MTTAEQPVVVRMVNAAGGLAQRCGYRPRLDARLLLETARRTTGLADFGPGGFRQGLEVLTESLEHDADLTTIGRIAARRRLLGLLETRLRLIDHRKRHPEVADRSIRRPIFVLGLPRTGTTVLYGLLAANPALRAPASWEVARPFPPPVDDGHNDARVAATQKEFDHFARIAPGLAHIHPLGATLPQECLALQAPAFASYEFPTTFHVPRYWTWLRGQDLRDAYEFERWFLQHLQSGGTAGQWLLKTPAHLMWLGTLLEVFPDALLVHTHRDPSEVLASVSSLMYAFRSAMSSGLSPELVGREQLEAWVWGLDRAMTIRAAVPADRVIDIDYRDTVEDPVGTVRRVYEHFGVEVTPAVEDGVHAYLRDNPRDKHGTHRYTLEEFGLERGEVDAAFAAYRRQFGMTDD